MYIFFSETPLGEIGIAEQNETITHLYFPRENLPKKYELKETPLLKEAFNQLHAYFSGTLKKFTLPLSPAGTDFMQKVWNALRQIPYGKTASYQDIAIAIGNSKAVRAVGMANNRNPIPIFIPCHRVIGKNGSLIGYGGGLDIKEKLLILEAKNI